MECRILCECTQQLLHILICKFCDLNLSRSAVSFTSTGHINCVSKETVTRHSTAHDSSHHISTVYTNTHLLCVLGGRGVRVCVFVGGLCVCMRGGVCACVCAWGEGGCVRVGQGVYHRQRDLILIEIDTN